MEGSKETSRSSGKKDVETKMVLSTDIQLEGSKERNRSSSKKGVITKKTLSSDIQLGDSQELSRSPCKKEVEKKVLNIDTYLKDRRRQVDVKKKDTSTKEDQSTDINLEYNKK